MIFIMQYIPIYYEYFYDKCSKKCVIMTLLIDSKNIYINICFNNDFSDKRQHAMGWQTFVEES